MNKSTFTQGQEVYSKSLATRVVIVFISGGYAYVRDEDNNSYAVNEKDLQPIDWDADDITKREG